MGYEKPSLDPGMSGTLVGAFQLALKKMLQGMDGMTPARVESYDRASNRVQVRPVIKITGTDGLQQSRASISSLPVFRFGGGGFVINAPLKPGDLGMIFAADRDISGFLKGYENSSPQTDRIKDFSDGWFIPDKMTNITLSENDEDSLVIQSEDGKVKISLSLDTIEIAAPNIVITSDASLEINAGSEVEITGNLKVIGNIQATGEITPNVPP